MNNFTELLYVAGLYLYCITRRLYEMNAKWEFLSKHSSRLWQHRTPGPKCLPSQYIQTHIIYIYILHTHTHKHTQEFTQANIVCHGVTEHWHQPLVGWWKLANDSRASWLQQVLSPQLFQLTNTTCYTGRFAVNFLLLKKPFNLHNFSM